MPNGHHRKFRCCADANGRARAGLRAAILPAACVGVYLRVWVRGARKLSCAKAGPPKAGAVYEVASKPGGPWLVAKVAKVDKTAVYIIYKKDKSKARIASNSTCSMLGPPQETSIGESIIKASGWLIVRASLGSASCNSCGAEESRCIAYECEGPSSVRRSKARFSKVCSDFQKFA